MAPPTAAIIGVVEQQIRGDCLLMYRIATAGPGVHFVDR